MEFTRARMAIAAPKPETRFLPLNAGEIAAGGPFDAAVGKHLKPGEPLSEPLETATGKHAATFEGITHISLEAAEAGRCANCRDNSRVRYMMRVTDQHGVRKWCVPCLVERYNVDPAQPDGG